MSGRASNIQHRTSNIERQKTENELLTPALSMNLWSEDGPLTPSLSMNRMSTRRFLGVRGHVAALQDAAAAIGSWSQCMRKIERRLPMNRKHRTSNIQ
jgi:hypothetical protein